MITTPDAHSHIDLLAACLILEPTLLAASRSSELSVEVRVKAFDAHVGLLRLELALRNEQLARLS